MKAKKWDIGLQWQIKIFSLKGQNPAIIFKLYDRGHCEDLIPQIAKNNLFPFGTCILV